MNGTVFAKLAPKHRFLRWTYHLPSQSLIDKVAAWSLSHLPHPVKPQTRVTVIAQV